MQSLHRDTEIPLMVVVVVVMMWTMYDKWPLRCTYFILPKKHVGVGPADAERVDAHDDALVVGKRLGLHL